MAKQSAAAKIEALLRKHALSYPEAYEEFPWGERAIKVKGKVFVFMINEGRTRTIKNKGRLRAAARSLVFLGDNHIDRQGCGKGCASGVEMEGHDVCCGCSIGHLHC